MGQLRGSFATQAMRWSSPMTCASGDRHRDADTQALIPASAEQQFVSTRDCALVSVLLHAGIRVGEAIALTPLDLDPRAGTIIVRTGFSGVRRDVVMMRPGWPFLMRWLEHRRELQLSPSGLLFCSRQGFPITCGYAASLLERVADFAGIAKRPIAHGSRPAPPR